MSEISHEHITFDSCGRPHQKWPRTGPSFVFNRATKFYSSSINYHLIDLKKVIDENKSGLTLISDGGGDWSPRSAKNNFELGMFWMQNDLDFVIHTSYAPGHSAQNPIEHLWSPLTRWLNGVYFKACMVGEDTPPDHQPGLSDADKEAKNMYIFNRALEHLNTYWHGRKFDEWPIHSFPVECQSVPPTDTDIADALNAGVKQLRTNEHIKSTVKQMKIISSHMDKRSFVCIIKKCPANLAPSCSYCSEHPCKDNNVVHFLSKYGIFTPTPSQRHEGHYMTYSELKLAVDLGVALPKPDEHCPSLRTSTSPKERCEKCKYVFKSNAEYEQHYTVFHGERKRKQVTRDDDIPKKRALLCTCGINFATYYQLNKHKRESGHQLKQGRPKKK
jgi:hypothetical protein